MLSSLSKKTFWIPLIDIGIIIAVSILIVSSSIGTHLPVEDGLETFVTILRLANLLGFLSVGYFVIVTPFKGVWFPETTYPVQSLLNIVGTIGLLLTFGYFLLAHLLLLVKSVSLLPIAAPFSAWFYLGPLVFVSIGLGMYFIFYKRIKKEISKRASENRLFYLSQFIFACTWAYGYFLSPEIRLLPWLKSLWILMGVLFILSAMAGPWMRYIAARSSTR